MNEGTAHEFVRHWLEAWNSHDVDAVLAHFADEVTFTSPVAARIVAGSDGVIRGKTALRTYWSNALRLIPDVHFELVGVYLGIDTLTINYRNQNGGLVNEVLRFDGEFVVEGHGTYLSEG
jgi:ketosteroid isomerase-like protein